ncbi:hypothetical protein PLICRDRAFT_175173 [Plicaturopsis crispa FD-325 SS-3]|nr:hypothetical protein PLICRDRAFT_175173 [Plicaturopsis crispa FD-325 SS-3]
MVSKKLMGAWMFLDFCLLASGAIALAFSIAWRAPNVLLNLVFSNADLTAGTVLGIAMLISFAFSIGAIVQRNHVTLGLVILNWILIVDALGIVIIGTFVWFFTLQERNNYHAKFLEASTAQQIAIQDKLNCCGYFNTSDAVAVGGLCSSADFAVQHNSTCVLPITAFADTTLNDVFTTVRYRRSKVYGFMAVIICFFLASLCVIKKRQETERFKKIDAKRGGKGFV